MPKKISNPNNPPVQLKGEIKFHYQGHFLHYINEFVPEVSIEIRKLTQRCEELFGNFPELINTIKDNSNFYISSTEGSAQRNFWNDIDRVFIDCIYKESRENAGSYFWRETLIKFDEDLNKANEIENKYLSTGQKRIDV
jgi:hypothetical protein